MSKTIETARLIEAEIKRLTTELERLMTALDVVNALVPTSKTAVAVGYLTMEESAGATIAEKRATAQFVLNRPKPAFVSDRSVLPVGTEKRERLVLKTIGTGAMTSGEVIRKIGCTTKQDKQMVYVALSRLKAMRYLFQDETTRQYSDAQS